LQCPAGTFVCLQVQNKKAGAEPELRTVHVVPIVQETEQGALKAEWSTTTETVAGYPKKVPTLVGRLSGGVWSSGPQTLVISLACVDEDDSMDEPVLKSWENNELRVDWNTKHACARGPDSPPPGSEPAKKATGRGFWGWFFLLCVLPSAAARDQVHLCAHIADAHVKPC
jgi:hypothetical protein